MPELDIDSATWMVQADLDYVWLNAWSAPKSNAVLVEVRPEYRNELYNLRKAILAEGTFVMHSFGQLDKSKMPNHEGKLYKYT
jgi:hypothetical protein